MGLPARQRKRLEHIEDRLRSSDPRLAAMFAIFGRLTQDEDMPRMEELRHRAAVLTLRVRLWLAAVGSALRITRRHPGTPVAGTPVAGTPIAGTPGSGSRTTRPRFAGSRVTGPPIADAYLGPGANASSPRAGRRPAAGRPRRQAGKWRPMAIFFPLALVLMSLSIFVAARFGSAPRCVAATAVATAKLHPRGKPLAKGGSKAGSKAARRCRPAMLTVIPIGR